MTTDQIVSLIRRGDYEVAVETAGDLGPVLAALLPIWERRPQLRRSCRRTLMGAARQIMAVAEVEGTIGRVLDQLDQDGQLGPEWLRPIKDLGHLVVGRGPSWLDWRWAPLLDDLRVIIASKGEGPALHELRKRWAATVYAPTDHWLSTAEVAEALGMAYKHLGDMARVGVLGDHALKIGEGHRGHWLLDPQLADRAFYRALVGPTRGTS